MDKEWSILFRKLLNLLFKVLAIFSWFQAVVGIGTLIIVMLVDDDFTFAHLVIFIIVISLFILTGLGFWLISNKIKENNQTLKEFPKNQKIKENKISRVTVEITTDTPNEVLTEMKNNYSLMQAEGDLKILSDSIELIKSTSNIETFISRFELAQQKALTLEQAVSAGVKIPSKITSFKELNDLKQIYAPKILKEAYEKVKNDASKLKTEKGRLNRYQKFNDLLEENNLFFDEFEEYDEVISSLMKDIKKYSTSNFGG